MDEANPFLRYRKRLDSYEAVTDGHLSDQQFVDIVSTLDSAVADVDGHGFARTPVVDGSDLAAVLDVGVDLWIKNDTGNVSGSHKSRHLFGVAIHMAIESVLSATESAAASTPPPLAIASCGNAAMAAGIVAAAMKRHLLVFVPEWADQTVVARLEDLGADLHRCPRIEGEAGDPAYLRFSEAAADGAQPFSVQGTDTPSTFDGGRTLGWEMADQIAERVGGGLDAIFIQVGGGALATATSRALPEAKLFPVQAEGCAPLARAWDLMSPDFDFASAATNSESYMWPWDDPQSAADGILDDVTYDWLPLLAETHRSGGHPIVAPEATVVDTHAAATSVTGIAATATATAGMAGLVAFRQHLGELPRLNGQRPRVGVFFTGLQRT